MSEHVQKKALAPRASRAGAIDAGVLARASRAAGLEGWPARVAALACAGAIVALGLFAGVAAAGLGLLALASAVVVWRHSFLLGPLVLLLLPASGAAHVLGAQVAPLEAVLGGGAIGYVLGVLLRRETVRLELADWAFVALLVAMAISLLGPVDDSDRIRELLFWGALGVVFHAVRANLRGAGDRRFLLVALATATLIEASTALYEYVERWSERFSSLHGAIVYPLPQGTLGHPNALAMFLVLAVLGVLALALAERRVLRWCCLVVVALGSLALVVTFSRASWIAFLVGASIYLVDRRTRIPAAAVGTSALAGAVILAVFQGGAIGARVGSVFTSEAGDLYDFRLELISRAARLSATHPLTGTGHFEEVGVYAGRPDIATHPHNLFFGIAVFFGLPAALAFSTLVVLGLRAAWRGYRSRPESIRLTALGFVALLVAFVVNGILEYPLWNISLATLVVVLLAVASSLEPVLHRPTDTSA